MIILKFFKENFRGIVKDVNIYSHSTRYLLGNDPEETDVKDLDVEAVIHKCH